VAQARLRIGSQTVEVFGPRAEQIAHLLDLRDSRTAQQLSERLGDHVADDEKEGGALDLDADEQFELLAAEDDLMSAVKDPADDVVELQSALRSPLKT
jgi:hypothetical protein